jgi:NAD(P)-dependent dehydrogenase (short-subunit alcohol dehydrogenase family)
MPSFEGKTAVVTGGSTGIGRAIAFELATHGASVAVGDIEKTPGQGERYGPESSDPTHVVINEQGGNASFAEVDVSNATDCQALIEHAIDMYGRLDILVNNAGIHIPADIEDLAVEDWEQVLGVNLSGAFYCSKFAVPHLSETAGSIVNISSVHAIEGGSGPPYAASKAALVNLTRDIATTLGPHDVTANTICPGFIKTPRQDYLSDDEIEASREQTVLPRLGTPKDVAAAALFLLSDNASWITGESLFVDGGWTAHRGV